MDFSHLMLFHDRLKSERKRLGLRSIDFAAAVGVAGPTQSLYETGKRSPDAAYLQRACELGMDGLFLLTGTRVPPPRPLADAEAAKLDSFVALPPKVRAALVGLVELVRDPGHD